MSIASLLSFVALSGCAGRTTETKVESDSAAEPAGLASKVPGELVFDDAFHEARRLYFVGLESDPNATKRARGLFAQLSSRTSGDARREAITMVYLGSCELLEAGRDTPLLEKEAMSRRGLARMEEAVRRMPEDLEVRFVRGSTSDHLPFFFGRGKVAAEDLKFVAERARAGVARGALPAELGAASCFFYAKFAEREGGAAARGRWLSEAVAIGPETPAGKRAAKELAGSR